MAGPQRSCVSCRRKGAKGELIKLANTPGGVVIDYSEKLPGRGAYLCPDAACIEKGLKPEQLKRAFRQDARPPGIDEFYSELQGKVVRKIESLLGMARKSGAAAMGFDAALGAAEKSPDGLLIVAGDVSENTGRKLAESGRALRTARFSSKGRLGEVLGVRPVGVVYISSPALAAALDREMGRLNIK